ncbi:MAG: YebC/PmpR family DNA-binding transcriptional regulator [Campylobacterales bacterium]|nr:YebC/PmpR family DNA-binding transcriptional regulator [Campylobacterales bacterium]
MGRAFEYRKAAKMKRWGNMSRVFPKLQKAITIAAKNGGANPDTNPALRTAITTAKAQNLPKDNIEAAIKRATAKDAADLSEVNYEGKWQHGVLVFVEAATDNNTRTVANIKNIFKKAGGEIVPTGSLEFMFSRKAVFELKTPQIDMDELEMELIDAGLEEIRVDDEEHISIIADYTDFGSMSKKLDEMQLEYEKGSLQRIPNSPIEISDEAMLELEALLDKLEDDDDVQNIYTNLA